MTTVGWALPDTEAAFATFLNASTKVPKNRPATFCRVSLAGGRQSAEVLATARLIVECWAPTEPEAAALARVAWARCQSVRGAFIAEGCWVTQMELDSPVNFPDDESGSPRYQFVAQATVALTPVEVSP